ARLDDLEMVYAGVKALINTPAEETGKVLVLFDNEEVGSMTKQGAASPMLRNILERLVLNQGYDSEAFYRALSRSFILSADMAHAIHPNYPEKHDPTNKPVLNGGPVIKLSANQRYTSNSESVSVIKGICEKKKIPYQFFVNRSEQKGGSTIGPVSSTQLDINSVDIGNPLLAMHSIRELAGVKDHLYLMKLFDNYYRF
ncbi:MAG TPA: M18 family aminopeptidase, partial [Halanaerobiales bacterium]|nr:M18 family aminopeptidase [Halanaerobiales bacterium]